MDRTIDLLRPYQSTRDPDGIRTDREDVQDIAYDGDCCGRTRWTQVTGDSRWKRRNAPTSIES